MFVHLFSMLQTLIISLQVQACAHPFFDELRNPNTTMPDKTPLAPELFQFTSEELALATPETLEVLMSNGSVMNSPMPAAEPQLVSASAEAAPVSNNEPVTTVADTTAAPPVTSAPSVAVLAPPPATAVPSVVVEESAAPAVV